LGLLGGITQRTNSGSESPSAGTGSMQAETEIGRLAEKKKEKIGDGAVMAAS